MSLCCHKDVLLLFRRYSKVVTILSVRVLRKTKKTYLGGGRAVLCVVTELVSEPTDQTAYFSLSRGGLRRTMARIYRTE